MALGLFLFFAASAAADAATVAEAAAVAATVTAADAATAETAAAAVAGRRDSNSRFCDRRQVCLVLPFFKGCVLDEALPRQNWIRIRSPKNPDPQQRNS